MFEAYTRPRYQVSVYRNIDTVIGPLVTQIHSVPHKIVCCGYLPHCMTCMEKY